MAAIDSNLLFDETKCYACLGMSMAQLLELGLLRRTLLARSPNADVSMQGLMTYATCYGCYGASSFELLKLALLDLISQS
jgi:hypothetical protein